MPTKQSQGPGGDEILFAPVLRTGRGFYVAAGILLAVAVWGAYAYTVQLRYGLGVTGLNRPVAWGFYIVNFVFFIGISHAGTLISAILRLVNAGWRRPVTRCAEAITVFAFDAGQGLSEHSAPYDAVVQILDGYGEIVVVGRVPECRSLVYPAEGNQRPSLINGRHTPLSQIQCQGKRQRNSGRVNPQRLFEKPDRQSQYQGIKKQCLDQRRVIIRHYQRTN